MMCRCLRPFFRDAQYRAFFSGQAIGVRKGEARAKGMHQSQEVAGYDIFAICFSAGLLPVRTTPHAVMA